MERMEEHDWCPSEYAWDGVALTAFQTAVAPVSVRRKGGSTRVCQVDDCCKDLSKSKGYNQTHRICEAHQKAGSFLHEGQPLRFCQQCAKLHDLQAFEGAHRSCKEQLLLHRMRRRGVKAATVEEAAQSAVTEGPDLADPTACRAVDATDTAVELNAQGRPVRRARRRQAANSTFGSDSPHCTLGRKRSTTLSDQHDSCTAQPGSSFIQQEPLGVPAKRAASIPAHFSPFSCPSSGVQGSMRLPQRYSFEDQCVPECHDLFSADAAIRADAFMGDWLGRAATANVSARHVNPNTQLRSTSLPTGPTQLAAVACTPSACGHPAIVQSRLVRTTTQTAVVAEFDRHYNSNMASSGGEHAGGLAGQTLPLYSLPPPRSSGCGDRYAPASSTLRSSAAEDALLNPRALRAVHMLPLGDTCNASGKQTVFARGAADPFGVDGGLGMFVDEQDSLALLHDAQSFFSDLDTCFPLGFAGIDAGLRNSADSEGQQFILAMHNQQRVSELAHQSQNMWLHDHTQVHTSHSHAPTHQLECANGSHPPMQGSMPVLALHPASASLFGAVSKTPSAQIQPQIPSASSFSLSLQGPKEESAGAASRVHLQTMMQVNAQRHACVRNDFENSSNAGFASPRALCHELGPLVPPGGMTQAPFGMFPTLFEHQQQDQQEENQQYQQPLQQCQPMLALEAPQPDQQHIEQLHQPWLPLDQLWPAAQQAGQPLHLQHTQQVATDWQHDEHHVDPAPDGGARFIQPASSPRGGGRHQQLHGSSSTSRLRPAAERHAAALAAEIESAAAAAEAMYGQPAQPAQVQARDMAPVAAVAARDFAHGIRTAPQAGGHRQTSQHSSSSHATSSVAVADEMLAACPHVGHPPPFASSLERMSIKFSNCKPDDLVPDMRARLISWLTHADAELVQGFIMQGCTHLILDCNVQHNRTLFDTSGAALSLAKMLTIQQADSSWGENIANLTKAAAVCTQVLGEDMLVGRDVHVQAGCQVLHLSDGQPVNIVAVPSDVPWVESTSVLAIPTGQPVTFMVHGAHLQQPGCHLVARHQGQLLPLTVQSVPSPIGSSTIAGTAFGAENMPPSLVSHTLAPDQPSAAGAQLLPTTRKECVELLLPQGVPRPGLVTLEGVRGQYIGTGHPLLAVAMPDVASEVNAFAARDPVSARAFLVEFGQLLDYSCMLDELLKAEQATATPRDSIGGDSECTTSSADSIVGAAEQSSACSVDSHTLEMLLTSGTSSIGDDPRASVLGDVARTGRPMYAGPAVAASSEGVPSAVSQLPSDRLSAAMLSNSCGRDLASADMHSSHRSKIGLAQLGPDSGQAARSQHCRGADASVPQAMWLEHASPLLAAGQAMGVQHPLLSTHLEQQMMRRAVQLIDFCCQRPALSLCANEVLAILQRRGLSLVMVDALVRLPLPSDACRTQQLSCFATASLLHKAACCGCVATMAWLLRTAAAQGVAWNLSTPGPAGITPLHLLASRKSHSHAAAVMLLTVPGAAAAWLSCAAYDGATPGHLAVRAGLAPLNRLATAIAATTTAAAAVTPAARHAGSTDAAADCAAATGCDVPIKATQRTLLLSAAVAAKGMVPVVQPNGFTAGGWTSDGLRLSDTPDGVHLAQRDVLAPGRRDTETMLLTTPAVSLTGSPTTATSIQPLPCEQAAYDSTLVEFVEAPAVAVMSASPPNTTVVGALFSRSTAGVHRKKSGVSSVHAASKLSACSSCTPLVLDSCGQGHLNGAVTATAAWGATSAGSYHPLLLVFFPTHTEQLFWQMRRALLLSSSSNGGFWGGEGLLVCLLFGWHLLLLRLSLLGSFSAVAAKGLAAPCCLLCGFFLVSLSTSQLRQCHWPWGSALSSSASPSRVSSGAPSTQHVSRQHTRQHLNVALARTAALFAVSSLPADSLHNLLVTSVCWASRGCNLAVQTIMDLPFAILLYCMCLRSGCLLLGWLLRPPNGSVVAFHLLLMLGQVLGLGISYIRERRARHAFMKDEGINPMDAQSPASLASS